MSVKLKITVTKEILEKSKMCEYKDDNVNYVVENCAIALAVRDIFPHARVYGGGFLAFFGQSHTELNKRNSVDLPKKAKIFISHFDLSSPIERVKLKPISFEINIPDKVIEKINIDELKPLLQNHPTLQLVE